MNFINKNKVVIAYLIICVFLLSSCGNSEGKSTATSGPVTEAVIEVPDTTGPVIELATDNVAYFVGEDYDPMTYIESVTDDSGENIIATCNDADVNIASPGDYIISYVAKDSAGNKTEKQLKFKVKKEYSRDEIKEIINKLIYDKYYTFDFEDQLDVDTTGLIDGAIFDSIRIWNNFDDKITDCPNEYFYGSDTNIYTSIYLEIDVSSKNLGKKNTNTDTLNSELIITTMLESGETELCSSDSIEIASNTGKMRLDSLYEGGNFIFNEKNYFKKSENRFCFNSEKQIDDFEKIVSSNNVVIKVNLENGESKTLNLNKEQCDNFCKIISFYKDLNQYVNNRPKNND